MAKTEKHDLPRTGSSDDFFIDCIWMSYRYCIGRHTAAASQHAPAIASFLLMNPDILPQSRRAFTAQDIRNEISWTLKYHPNVKISGKQNKVDTATILLKACYEAGLTGEEMRHCIFEIDLTKEACTIIPSQTEFESLVMDLDDLGPWIRLANWLDPHSKFSIPDGTDYIGFIVYKYDWSAQEVREHKVPCQFYENHPYRFSYLREDLKITTTEI